IALPGLADLEGTDDVGMLELDRNASLALKPGQESRVLGLRRRQYLDGHDRSGFVLCFVDTGHTSLAEAIKNLVAPEKEPISMSACQQRRLVVREISVGHDPSGEQGKVLGVLLRLLVPAREHLPALIQSQQFAANEQTVDVLYRQIHVDFLRSF